MVDGVLAVEGDAQAARLDDEDLHGLDGVCPDDLGVLEALLVAEAAVVEQLELLEDGGLAGLAGAEQQQLDLALLLLLLLEQRALDGVVGALPLNERVVLVLVQRCAGSATHVVM